MRFAGCSLLFTVSTGVEAGYSDGKAGVRQDYKGLRESLVPGVKHPNQAVRTNSAKHGAGGVSLWQAA